ncbi:MAG: hypothetical protein U1F53_10030 [Burkholderiaceae bacterium]
MSAQASETYSRDLQEKFELYVLSLLFTLLAAAVQTSSFGKNIAADSLELTSWLLLLSSGLIGLWRMEWLPVAHSTHGARLRKEQFLKQVDAAVASGTTEIAVEGKDDLIPIQDARTTLVEQIAKAKAAEEAFGRSAVKRYRWHRATFALGLGVLMASRAYLPAAGIYEAGKKLVESPTLVSAPAASASQPGTGDARVTGPLGAAASQPSGSGMTGR